MDRDCCFVNDDHHVGYIVYEASFALWGCIYPWRWSYSRWTSRVHRISPATSIATMARLHHQSACVTLQRSTGAGAHERIRLLTDSRANRRRSACVHRKSNRNLVVVSAVNPRCGTCPEITPRATVAAFVISNQSARAVIPKTRRRFIGVLM